MALAIEATARLGLDRASRIQRRMVDEYRQARAIGHDGMSGRHLLVVGNSLLDEGVRFDRVRDALEVEWDARRFMVEQTVFFDWYYALKRLYREGAKPDVVLVVLGTGHWLSSGIRGDYSAQYMMNIADVPAATRDLHLHPTQATGMLFASISKFWGARAEMRNFVLGRLMPNLGELMNFSMVIDRRPMVDTDVKPILIARIDRMNQLISADGGRLVLLLPPMLNPVDGAAPLMEAARVNGVVALRPVASGSLEPALYRDSDHLNERGSAVFTERLISALRQELPTATRAAQGRAAHALTNSR